MGPDLQKRERKTTVKTVESVAIFSSARGGVCKQTCVNELQNPFEGFTTPC
jgi:hypothetical protein